MTSCLILPMIFEAKPPTVQSQTKQEICTASSKISIPKPRANWENNLINSELQSTGSNQQGRLDI